MPPAVSARDGINYSWTGDTRDCVGINGLVRRPVLNYYTDLYSWLNHQFFIVGALVIVVTPGKIPRLLYFEFPTVEVTCASSLMFSVIWWKEIICNGLSWSHQLITRQISSIFSFINKLSGATSLFVLRILLCPRRKCSRKSVRCFTFMWRRNWERNESPPSVYLQSLLKTSKS